MLSIDVSWGVMSYVTHMTSMTYLTTYSQFPHPDIPETAPVAMILEHER
jgi:hypothetical protein